MDDKTKDPALYREMVVPFASDEDIHLAFKGFLDEMYELRKKYRIGDVHIIVMANVLKPNEQEQARIFNAHYGDEDKAEYMCAWAMRQEHIERERRVAALAGDPGEGVFPIKRRKKTQE